MSVLALLSVVVAAGAGQVSLRGGEAAPAGVVVRSDAEGLWIGPEAGKSPTLVIGWDRVRSVAGAGDAGAFEETGEMAWRARARLERGDLVAAEPMLERLFETYRGQKGPTAAVIAEGLLRCRVRRAAHVAAVDPWLALLVARQTKEAPWLHAEWASDAGLGSVIDDATGLAPALPPIWLNWPSVAAWARAEPSSSGDARAAMLAALYLASARYEAGLKPALPDVVVNDPGVQIVADIVTARMGDGQEREDARARLRARMTPAGSAAPPPAWLEAWCRAGLGRSLVLEADPNRRRLGVVELLHVPARFAGTHPYLAGIALAEAAATLRDLGDDAGAGVLEQELRAMYPTHPVLDWEPSRRGAASPARVIPAGPGAEQTEQP